MAKNTSCPREQRTFSVPKDKKGLLGPKDKKVSPVPTDKKVYLYKKTKKFTCTKGQECLPVPKDKKVYLYNRTKRFTCTRGQTFHLYQRTRYTESPLCAGSNGQGNRALKDKSIDLILALVVVNSLSRQIVFTFPFFIKVLYHTYNHLSSLNSKHLCNAP